MSSRPIFTFMREMRLIVPKDDNDGRSLDDLHRTVHERLAQAFNGFTEMSATGVWVCPASGEVVREPVVSYTIAVHDRQGEAQVLLLAEWIAIEAGQDAIYLRLRDGTVKFVTPPAKDEQKHGLAASERVWL